MVLVKAVSVNTEIETVQVVNRCLRMSLLTLDNVSGKITDSRQVAL